MKLSSTQQAAICKAAYCQQIIDITPMQSLWAGQGELARLSLLTNADEQNKKSLVVKQIVLTPSTDHPLGWNTQLSQHRKKHSYGVELQWYRQYSQKAEQYAPMPRLIYCEDTEQGMLLVLEDLAVDYPSRFTTGKEDRPTDIQIASCIRWLAQFHAKYLNHDVDGLWTVGGYWHLDTRPDEWHAMQDSALKASATTFDAILKACPYQSIIHGDAKLANFCFDNSGEQVSAVDFQYVGQGPGVKDLMLLISSVMPDERLVQQGNTWVDYYFEQLALGLNQWQAHINSDDVISAWQPLYAVAWADFHRFLAGWSPKHWKIGQYCQQQTQTALELLTSKKLIKLSKYDN